MRLLCPFPLCPAFILVMNVCFPEVLPKWQVATLCQCVEPTNQWLQYFNSVSMLVMVSYVLLNDQLQRTTVQCCFSVFHSNLHGFVCGRMHECNLWALPRIASPGIVAICWASIICHTSLSFLVIFCLFIPVVASRRISRPKLHWSVLRWPAFGQPVGKRSENLGRHPPGL